MAMSVIAVLSVTPMRTSGASPTPAEEYLDLVDAYRAGETRAAIQALSNRDDGWIESAYSSALKSATPWPEGRAEAAVLLHTEVVTGDWVLPSHVPVHLNAARRLMASTREWTRNRFRHDWLLVLCWHFQGGFELGAALPWVDELRDDFGDDPETDLVAGSFYEVLGWSAWSPGSLTWSRGSRTLSALPNHTQREGLEAAAAAFERATRQPSTRDEASVRLGRVLAELGRNDAARTRLAPLIDGASEKRWRYLAAVFTASAEASAGRAEAEAAAYSKAAELMPGCPTPLVGLMALSRRRGEATRAAALAQELTSSAEHRCNDPWWSYRFGPSPERLPQLLEHMRKDSAP